MDPRVNILLQCLSYASLLKHKTSHPNDKQECHKIRNSYCKWLGCHYSIKDRERETHWDRWKTRYIAKINKEKMKQSNILDKDETVKDAIIENEVEIVELMEANEIDLDVKRAINAEFATVTSGPIFQQLAVQHITNMLIHMKEKNEEKINVMNDFYLSIKFNPIQEEEPVPIETHQQMVIVEEKIPLNVEKNNAQSDHINLFNEINSSDNEQNVISTLLEMKQISQKKRKKSQTSPTSKKKKRIYNELNKMILKSSVYLSIVDFDMGGENFHIPLSCPIIKM